MHATCLQDASSVLLSGVGRQFLVDTFCATDGASADAAAACAKRFLNAGSNQPLLAKECMQLVSGACTFSLLRAVVG